MDCNCIKHYCRKKEIARKAINILEWSFYYSFKSVGRSQRDRKIICNEWSRTRHDNLKKKSVLIVLSLYLGSPLRYEVLLSQSQRNKTRHLSSLVTLYHIEQHNIESCNIWPIEGTNVPLYRPLWATLERVKTVDSDNPCVLISLGLRLFYRLSLLMCCGLCHVHSRCYTPFFSCVKTESQ